MSSEEVPRSIGEYDERFKIMADVAPVMIWMAGLDKLCNFFNHPWLEFTGRTMEQEMGNGWAEGVHPDDMDRCLGIYVSSFDARKDFRMEYRLKRYDGEYRWILDTGRPIISANGTFMGYIGSCIDITDLKLTEERNRRLQEQVYQAQKMEAIGSLAAGIAHDLKNLLTIVQGSAELIQLKTEKGSKVHEHADRISAASLRASDMVRKLLLFSRRQPLSRNWMDYGLVIENMLDLIHGLIPKEVIVEYERPRDLWMINADAGLLEQVLVNLVTNARDAITGEGTIVVSLKNVVVGENEAGTDKNSTPGNYVVLEVTDSGKGMEPEELTRIFEPFYTTKPIGFGTGLGLPIVYGVVKEHGGWVEVISRKGTGSTFRAYLPADPSVRLAERCAI